MVHKSPRLVHGLLEIACIGGHTPHWPKWPMGSPLGHLCYRLSRGQVFKRFPFPVLVLYSLICSISHMNLTKLVIPSSFRGRNLSLKGVWENGWWWTSQYRHFLKAPSKTNCTWVGNRKPTLTTHVDLVKVEIIWYVLYSRSAPTPSKSVVPIKHSCPNHIKPSVFGSSRDICWELC